MKINLKKFSYISVCLYTIGVLFANTGWFFYACTSLLWITGILLIIHRKGRVTADLFAVGYLVFIAYLFLMVIFGKTMYPSAALSRIRSMILNLYMNLTIMAVLTDAELREKYMSFFTGAAVVLLFYIIAFSNTGLLGGRLGFDVNAPVTFGSNGNGLGLTLLLAILFDWSFYLEDKRPFRILRMILLFFGILLTGSRKAIFMLPFVFGSLYVIRSWVYYRNRALKILKIIIGLLTFIVVLYLLLTRVSSLYAIAGKRIEQTLLVFFSEDGPIEDSLRYRRLFVQIAKDYFFKHPIVGIGIDNFAQINVIKGYYTHNDYWEILTGGGIIGAILYYQLYVIVIRRLLKVKKQTHAYIYLAFMLTLLLYGFQMVTYLQRNIMIFFFIANAVCLSASKEVPLDAEE